MITVNGAILDEESVGRELQYHPGPDRRHVARRAATALVIRELLSQRARQLGIDCGDGEDFDALIVREVILPEPSDEEIERYRRRNWMRLRTPSIYEAAHIFFPASPDDEGARAEAKAKAEAVLALALNDPKSFAELARAHSSCASASEGGALGQVSRGDTNEEVERHLAAMEPGTIFPEPVASRHGYHILRLDRRDKGRELPDDKARELVATYLRESVRRRAVSQYLRLLAAEARIEGIALDLPDDPLVQ